MSFAVIFSVICMMLLPEADPGDVPMLNEDTNISDASLYTKSNTDTPYVISILPAELTNKKK